MTAHIDNPEIQRHGTDILAKLALYYPKPGEKVFLFFIIIELIFMGYNSLSKVKLNHGVLKNTLPMRFCNCIG